MINKDIFDEITARVTAFMSSRNNLLLLKCHVGSGKTWNTIKTLHDRGDNWIYLAPFHTVIDDNLKFSTLRNYDYLHLKSRAKECIVPDYKKIAERGIDIRPICESSCPLKETTCPYYETKRELFSSPCSWAGVHHHLKDFLTDFFSIPVDGSRMWKFYDVLIVDENPIGVLFENEIGNSESFGKLRDIINLLNIDHRDNNAVLDFVNFLITTFPGKEELDYDECLDLFQNVTWDSYYDSYQEKLVEDLKDEIIELNQVPKDYIKMFSYMKKDINEDNIEYMIVKKESSQYTKKKYHFMAFNNRALLNCPIKIIGLDGTANIDIWSSITDREPSILERRYVYENIYQLKGQSRARYPLSSWIRKHKITTTGKALCHLIDLICERRKNDTVLLACTKSLQKTIYHNINHRNIAFCNYYYIRSRNDFYERSDTIVLTSEPNIQEFQLDCFSALSGWDKRIWRQVFTQEEMKQTVGRVREAIGVTPTGRVRLPREIYIFPYTPPIEGSKEPLYSESTILNYDSMEFFLKKGFNPRTKLQEKIREDITNNGNVYISKLQNRYNITRSFCKSVLREMENNGEIRNRGGKKGWEFVYS